jgi:hypothetical protein
MTKRQLKQPARAAFPVLLEVCRTNQTITGDDIVDGLLSNSYDKDEIWRYVGPLIRMGAAEGLIEKTDTCTASKRNRSSLQRQWKSTIYKA